MYHEVIAAIGCLLFIALGITSQREGKYLITAGVTTESSLEWELFAISGVYVMFFSLWLVIYKIIK